MVFENETGTGGFDISQLNLTVERRADYDLRVNTSENLSTKSPDFNGHIVGLAQIDHSVPDSEIDGVQFTFRVDARRFESAAIDPDEAVVYRYHDGRWNALETSVLRRDGDSYILRADSPGLSTYAVGLRNDDLLSISGASLSGPSGTVGDPVTVSATVTNRGNWMADETVAVTANGTNVATRTITVPVGETKTISFDITLDHPGTYDVAVDGTSAGTLVLSEVSETTETSDTTAVTSTAPPSPRTTETVGTTHTTTTGESSKTHRNRSPDNWLFVAAGALALAALLVIRRR